MTRFSFALFLALLTVLPKPLCAIVKIEEVVSQKGLKAWSVEDKKTDVIALSASFRAGAAYDPQGKEGVAAMLSFLIDEGAGDYDATALHEKMQDLGISIGFSANLDRFYIHLTTTREHREEAFKILKLMLTRPNWTKEMFHNHQQRQLAYVANKEKTPGFITQHNFFEILFKGHPYARRVGGSKQSISSITPEDIKKFHREGLTQDGLIVGLCGNLSGAEAAQMLDEVFGDLPAKSSFPAIQKPTLPDRGSMKYIEAPYPQSTVLFGHRGILPSDKNFISLGLITHALAESSVSRLMTEVREKRGLVYNISAGPDALLEQALYIGSLGSENARVMKAIDLVKTEWTRIRDQGLTEEEFVAAKSHVLGSYAMNFVSSPAIASLVHLYQLYGMPRDYIEIREEEIRNTTLAEINQFAKSFFRPENLVFAIVGKHGAHQKKS